MELTGIENVLSRLRRLLPKLEAEDARRKKWDRWLRSVLRDGLSGASPDEVRRMLVKRHAIPQRAPTRSRTLERALRLQGKYIGSVRTLTKKNRSRVSSMRKRKGIKAAIDFARTLMNGETK